jgi:hypothetical protein
VGTQDEEEAYRQRLHDLSGGTYSYDDARHFSQQVQSYDRLMGVTDTAQTNKDGSTRDSSGGGGGGCAVAGIAAAGGLTALAIAAKLVAAKFGIV